MTPPVDNANPMFNPSRRTFLSVSAASALGLLAGGHGLGNVAATFPTTRRGPQRGRSNDEDVLEAFFVSDAHFGWTNAQQPTPEQIGYAIDRIVEYFPNLHLFGDTGDGHHNSAGDDARRDWTHYLANRVGPIPFIYCAGNHDAISFAPGVNPEARTAEWASVPGPLYYSVDIRGVHFLCLPPLMSMGYLTQAALDWARLDLSTNRNRTTIILSHNSVPGTTLPHDDLGYRRLTNGDAAQQLLQDNPQIVAWLHGHNHTFELVPYNGIMYASNGRIGGFSPPYAGEYGAGHLGGMYLRVQPDGVWVRGFSASARRFLDMIGNMTHLSGFLKTPTSVDALAPAACSVGFGGAPDGLSTRIHRHYVGKAREAELWAVPAAPVLNENPTFDSFVQRTNPNWRRKHMIGFAITPSEEDELLEDHSWEWLHPGLRILENTQTKHVFATGLNQATAYYPLPAMTDVEARCQLIADATGPQARLRLHLVESDGTTVATLDGDLVTLGDEAVEIVENFAAGNATPPDSGPLRAIAELELTGLSAAVNIYRFEIRLAGAETRMTQGAFYYGRSSTDAPLDDGGPAPVALGPDTTPEAIVQCNGSRRMTWLLREGDLVWQVRNAVARQTDDDLFVGPVRSSFAEGHIVIAPLTDLGGAAWVSKLEGIERAVIRPEHSSAGEVRVTMLEDRNGDAVAEFCGPSPSEVIGGEVLSSENGVTRVALNAAVGSATIYRFGPTGMSAHRQGKKPARAKPRRK